MGKWTLLQKIIKFSNNNSYRYRITTQPNLPIYIVTIFNMKNERSNFLIDLHPNLKKGGE
jgi:hypothetical protein